MKETFTGRIFRAFLSLALMLMGITGITVSLISMFVLRENVIEDNRQLLTQFSNSVSTTFAYVDNMTSHFVADQQLRNFLDYYDKKSIPQMNSVSRQLENFMMGNDYIHSMAIYYPQKDLVYAVNSGVIPVSYYYDSEFLQSLDLNDMLSIWKTPRTITDHYGQNSRLFSVLKPLKYVGMNPEAILIVNLDADLFTQVFSSISLNEHAYLAMNSAGVVVAYSQSAVDYLPESDTIYNALSSSGSKELALGKERFLISCIDSPDSSWKYYGMIKTSILYKEIMTLLTLSAAIFITGSIIAVLFSKLFSRKITAPIATIASQFEKITYGSQEESAEGDILQHIERGIAMLKTENQSISQSLAESMPILKNNFLISVLGGFVTDSEEIDRNLSYFRIELQRDCAVCASIIKINELDAETGKKYMPIQLHSFTTYLTDLLEATFSDKTEYLLCSSYENEITIISALPSLSCCNHREAALYTGKLIEKLFQNEKKHISSISVGSIESTIYDVRFSYANARKALALDFLSQDILIYYEDMQLLSTAITGYPYALEETLLAAIRSDSIENAGNALREILNHILMNTQNKKKVRTYFLMQLYSAFLKYARETNVTEFYLNASSNYTEILTLTKEALYPWFHGLLELIITQSLYKKSNPEQFLSERIKEYLQENYKKEISIADLSEVFLYSPTHLSRIFHKETGCSIKQYLTKIRMDKACELLADYSLKISEVGELTGYPKVHGFLKQFKNYTGMTPSEYKEKLSKGKQ